MTKINKQSKGYFTITNNQLIRDDRLSWKARGIFTYLWSMSDGWDFKASEVAKHASDGKDSLNSGLKELEEYGYLSRQQKRDDNGKLDGFEWVLTDSPVIGKPAKNNPKNADFPITENPSPEKPTTGNPPLSNNNLRSINLSSNKGKESSARTPQPPQRGLVEEVIDYLNLKTGKNFRATTPRTIRDISSRAKEGATLSDFKKVIDTKCLAWKDDQRMNEYLRPITLFSTKFESYLNEQPKQQQAPKRAKGYQF